jgi:hypothetical protein
LYRFGCANRPGLRPRETRLIETEVEHIFASPLIRFLRSAQSLFVADFAGIAADFSTSIVIDLQQIKPNYIRLQYIRRGYILPLWQTIN